MNVRAEKTTKNQDDFRVMIAGVVFCIFLILAQPFGLKVYDTYIAGRPFITATLEVKYVIGRDEPMVMYDADAVKAVNGIWTASIYIMHENEWVRYASRRGEGSYSSIEDEPRLWTWSAFFDNGQDKAPLVPSEIFRLCVNYDVTTNSTEVNDQTLEYCSPPYNPANPNAYLEG